MKNPWFRGGKKRSPAGLAASVIIHLVIIGLLTQMAFHYPLRILIGGYSASEHIKPEKLYYVQLPTSPPPSSVQTPPKARKPAGGRPAPLIAPTMIPSQLPPSITTITPRAQAAGGTGNGLGVVGGTGIATGAVPAVPDSRIRMAPGFFVLPAKTPAEKIDSIVADLYGDMIDSLEAVQHERKPGDWTVTKNGKKYGWDQQGIQLGKFMIPNALFALLPLKIQANPTTSSRYDEQMREDLLFHTRMTITEDEFEAAIKRIRARDEKLHEEQEKARANADSTSH